MDPRAHTKMRTSLPTSPLAFLIPLLLAATETSAALSSIRGMNLLSLNDIIGNVLTQELREPVYFPKGDKGLLFQNYDHVCKPDVEDYEDFKNVYNANSDKSKQKITLAPITIPKDIDFLSELSKDAHFSIFIPSHQQMATKLITHFLKFKNKSEYISLLVCLKDRTNLGLFIHALSVANAHRPDTPKLDLPNLLTTFPEHFFRSSVLRKAEMLLRDNAVRNTNITVVDLPIDFTSTDVEPEHWLAYFREDIALNLHHWHWHILFPFSDIKNSDGTSLLNRDRRGELFFYMHHQIMARYNFERLCNRLPLAKPMDDFSHPIPEGYYPKLSNLNHKGEYPGRPKNMVLNNIYQFLPDFERSVHMLNVWKSRILDAIFDGKVKLPSGEEMLLTIENGTDILGNLLEASDNSVNRKFYGSLHNDMHFFTSMAHDPDDRFMEGGGIMGQTSTAMRDPVFYRVHALVDYFYNLFKETLPAYTTDELDFPDVLIERVSVTTHRAQVENTFETYWEEARIELDRGLDFLTEGKKIIFKYTRLQHLPYQIEIKVKNTKGRSMKGTVRVFLAPQLNDRGRKWEMSDQRNMFIELDKFVYELKSGDNTIVRNSTDSTVSVEYPSDLSDAETQTRCGWPQHLLIPKGTHGGFSAQLVVVISEHNPIMLQSSEESPSYCGVNGQKYPDSKRMGYPFDRLPPPSKSQSLEEFLTPNMAAADILIYHKSVFVNSFERSVKRGHNFGTYPDVKPVQIKLLRPGVDGVFSGIPDKIQSPRLTTIGGEQYFFSYSIQDNIDITGTWDGARAYCKKMGMDLVSFPDKATLKRVIEYLRQTLTGRNRFLGHFNFWTSGRWISGAEYRVTPPYKHITDDVFKWSSNGEPVDMNFVIKSTNPGPCMNVYMGSMEHEDYWVNECSQQFQFMCSFPKNQLARSDLLRWIRL